MQHALRTWRNSQLIASFRPTPNLALRRTYARQRPEPQSRTEDLTEDDLRDIEAAVGAALREHQRQVPDYYVKPHRRYRGYKAYKELETSFLEAEVDATDSVLAKQLWRSYVEAKYRIQKLPTLLTTRAWDILQKSQSQAAYAQDERSKILKELSRDRDTVEMPHITPEEKLAQLKELYQSDSQKALSQWEEEHTMGQGRFTKDGHRVEHLDLGIRMFMTSGNLDRAVEITTEMIAAFPHRYIRVGLEVIKTLLNSQGAEDLDSAFTLYELMHARTSKALPLDFYDTMFDNFLARSQVRSALRVFQHMIEGGQLSSDVTSEAVKAVLRRLQRLHESSNDMQTVNEVFLTALLVLPTPYHSTIFKKWLMEMTSRDALDAAPQAIELMYERGLAPRTVHFNLLFSLLLRSPKEDVRQQGEDLAWRMMDELANSADPSLAQQQIAPQRYRRAFYLSRQVPPADASTFAQLITHYTKSFQYTRAEEVVNFYESIPASNTMHQPQQSAVLFDARAHLALSTGHAADIWEQLMRLGPAPTNLKYNSGLYIRLWRFLRNNYLSHARALDDEDNSPSTLSRSAHEAAQRPHPRFLMAHMTTWYRTLHPHERRKASLRFARFPRKYATDFGFLVAATFRLHRDVPGALVAMHALSDVLGLQVGKRTVQSFLKLLVNVGLRERTREDRWENSRRGRWQGRRGVVERAFRGIVQRRLREEAAERQKASEMAGDDGDEAEDMKRLMARMNGDDSSSADDDLDKLLEELGLDDTSLSEHRPSTPTQSSITGDTSSPSSQTLDSETPQARHSRILLFSLSELARVVLVQQYTPAEVERFITDAKRDMGVMEVGTGDVDAWGVL